MSGDTDRVQLLHEHYRDSCASLGGFLRTRDRLFAWLLVSMGLLLLQAVAPELTERAMAEVIRSQLGIVTSVGVSYLRSILWFAVLAMTVRYCQSVVHLDRHYRYIHQIEAELSPLFDGRAFTREGKFYLTDYPLFSQWAHFLYTWVFPIIFIVIYMTAFLVETSGLHSWPLPVYFDCVVVCLLMVSIAAYLLSKHFPRLDLWLGATLRLRHNKKGP